jgi:hypothetical protein
MMKALNSKWRRRTLAWKTATEIWATRPKLDVDRGELQEEVTERTARIRRRARLRGEPRDLAARLAIEQALVRRGLLKREFGGWC